jgi:hypothetical protein
MSNSGLLSPYLKQPVLTDRFGDLRTIPASVQTAAITLSANSGIGVSTSSNVTIPANLPVGFSTMIYNDSAVAITITTSASATSRISASATAKTSFSLFPYGICSVWSNKLNNLILSGDIA